MKLYSILTAVIPTTPNQFSEEVVHVFRLHEQRVYNIIIGNNFLTPQQWPCTHVGRYLIYHSISLNFPTSFQKSFSRVQLVHVINAQLNRACCRKVGNSSEGMTDGRRSGRRKYIFILIKYARLHNIIKTAVAGTLCCAVDRLLSCKYGPGQI